MDRRNPRSVRGAVTALWEQKLVHRGADKKIVLAEPGLREAIKAAQAQLA
jgi:hypothetical protein